ncbi:MAG: ribosome assembly cofactor RimP [Muribaculaceae bacterium]|nr:ribosome assembly cofactor RimP [Muribaculaceae bacterium]
MIDVTLLKDFIEKEIEGTDVFLVDVKVSQDNDITIEIDSDSPIGIDECERLTKKIESAFDREKEDYTLEVGSAGLTSPFKVRRQYQKYKGREVEVLTKDGKKFTGILEEVNEENFTIKSEEKVKKEGMKRPVLETVEHIFPYETVKQTKYLLKF